VDEELIRNHPMAKEGVKMLAQSNVLNDMIENSVKSLILGDPDESEEQLVEKIRKHRRDVGVLLTLQELGESFSEENRNEPR